jgi:hypothetical protein
VIAGGEEGSLSRQQKVWQVFRFFTTEIHSVMLVFSTQLCELQWWANLDQASKHLEVFRFRDLSPTPIP